MDQMTKISLESAHSEWLACPLNRRLLTRLEQDRQKLLLEVEQLADSPTEELQIRILLTKAKTIRSIIHSLKTNPEMLSTLQTPNK